MHLADYEIRLHCEQGMVKDYLPEYIRPHSLDFRLGSKIKVEKSPVDPDWYLEAIIAQQRSIIAGGRSPRYQYMKLQEAINAEGMFEDIDISRTTKENPYPMSPGMFILSAPIECLNLPKDITADIVLCSTMARRGLDHSLAGHADAGFYGIPTLEFKSNLQWHPVEIWHGMRIGQFIFDGNNQPHKSYAESSGHYQGDMEPMEAKQ